MKYSILLVLAASFFFACNQTEQGNGYHPDAEALQIEALKVYHRKPDSAISLLDKATQMDPSFYMSYNTKAMVLSTKEEYPKAIAELYKSLSWKADQPEVYLQLGMLNDQINMAEKAGDNYEKAIALYDTRLAESGEYEVQDRANRAIAIVMNGEFEKGNKILEGLMEKHPEDAFLKKLSRILENKPDSVNADKEFYLERLIRNE